MKISPFRVAAGPGESTRGMGALVEVELMRGTRSGGSVGMVQPASIRRPPVFELGL